MAELHTDIVAGGWVARLPASWRPYALLLRLDRPIGVWLLFLPGLWGLLISGAPIGRTAWLVGLFAVGSVAMRGAGCVVNDMWDRDLDRLVARTAGRPLASGALGMRQAWVVLAILLLIGLGVLLLLPPLCWALGVGSLVLVGLYPLAKRVTWWPQLVMGFTFGFGAPMGYAAGAGRIDWTCIAIYGAAILWDLGFDTVYAHQDRDDDAVAGVRSTARLWGERTQPFLFVCYGLTIAALAAAGWRAGLAAPFYLALPIPTAFLMWQAARLDIYDPEACLQLFRSNREAGLAVAMAILFGRL
jgi:4-hydroxybenzoate polyprenyltransferase